MSSHHRSHTSAWAHLNSQQWLLFAAWAIATQSSGHAGSIVSWPAPSASPCTERSTLYNHRATVSFSRPRPECFYPRSTVGATLSGTSTLVSESVHALRRPKWLPPPQAWAWSYRTMDKGRPLHLSWEPARWWECKCGRQCGFALRGWWSLGLVRLSYWQLEGPKCLPRLSGISYCCSALFIIYEGLLENFKRFILWNCVVRSRKTI